MQKKILLSIKTIFTTLQIFGILDITSQSNKERVRNEFRENILDKIFTFYESHSISIRVDDVFSHFSALAILNFKARIDEYLCSIRHLSRNISSNKYVLITA